LDELKKAPEELKKKLEDIDEQQSWRHRARARKAHVLGIAVKVARLAVHLLWIAVMGVYWALADYGRSLVRPFACWLVLSLIVFPWLYGQILPVQRPAWQKSQSTTWPFPQATSSVTVCVTLLL
jgi:hypothetical protein